MEFKELEKEQKTVAENTQRSDALFKNLAGELIRWEQSSKSFDERMANLIGDVLVSSGVLTYIGFFDHFQRRNLISDWNISVE